LSGREEIIRKGNIVNGELAGKVAIVTGGGRGMGRAIARHLSQMGATIVVAARTASYGEDAVADLIAEGGSASLYAGFELSNAESCRDVIATTVDRHGRLDALVLCAADASLGSVLDMDDQTFDLLVRSNFHSAFWFTKAAVPHLSRSGNGRIVYISSGSGNKVNTPSSVPYGASKAAVNALARGVAHAYSGLGITFNCINPGLIASDRMRSFLTEDAAMAIAAGFPVARPGTPEEIARAVGFLVSPGSSYITGVELCVDGGSSLTSISTLNETMPADTFAPD
jgi:3-oxoacyl-[acyl-carrier protein] reductase